MNPYAPELIGSNFGFHNYSLDYFLAGMSKLQISTIEFWTAASHLDFLGEDSATVDLVLKKIADSGIRVHCLTLEQVMYPINIASPNEGLRRRSIDHFRRAADTAAELAAPLMFMTTGRGLLDIPREETWARSVQAAQEIVSHAASQGVTCVLEPLQAHESELVNSLPQLVQFLADVDDERLQIVLDTVAMAVAGETVEDYFTVVGDRIGHVQFVDGSPAGHLAWGEGSLPLGKYARSIRDQGYSGKVSFEVFGPESYRHNPIEGLRRCLSSYTAAVEPESDLV